jgi:hypothetical protein
MGAESMSDEDYNPYDYLTEEQKARPYMPHTGLDETRWDGLAINPNYDASTYGPLPEAAPPEWPNPIDHIGVSKYMWDPSGEWIINPNFQELGS